MKEFLNIANISEKQLHIQMVPISKKLKAANDVVLLPKQEQNKSRQSRWEAGLWSKPNAGKRTSPYSFEVVVHEQEASNSMMVEL